MICFHTVSLYLIFGDSGHNSKCYRYCFSLLWSNRPSRVGWPGRRKDWVFLFLFARSDNPTAEPFEHSQTSCLYRPPLPPSLSSHYPPSTCSSLSDPTGPPYWSPLSCCSHAYFCASPQPPILKCQIYRQDTPHCRVTSLALDSSAFLLAEVYPCGNFSYVCHVHVLGPLLSVARGIYLGPTASFIHNGG